jgi:DNA-directed RNA polymerase subunit RPC12/RpoP
MKVAKEIKRLRCPKCGGENIQILGHERKFSVTKAALGAVVVPVVGVVAGKIGKKGKKKDVFCQDCGYHWQIK